MLANAVITLLSPRMMPVINISSAADMALASPSRSSRSAAQRTRLASDGSLGDKSIPYKVYGDEPVLDHDGPFQMRRCDTGELYCQDGNPVVYIGYKACAEACRYLHDNIGISCLPSPGRMHAWAAPKEPSVASMSGRRLTGPNKGACLARLPARLHKERTNG